MSLVGLKNLFFYRTFTPISQRPRSSPTSPYTEDAQRPLLADPGFTPGQDFSSADDTDVESQASSHSYEKSLFKKSFRVDPSIIKDATIGLSDGLTVPFALTAGLSALGNTKFVIYGGAAELIAGAISMGLGGYLGAMSEVASYNSLLEETKMQIASDPQETMQDIASVFEPYNLPQHTLEDLKSHMSSSPQLTDFIMQFKHQQSEPASSRAAISALTIGTGYLLGGFLPLFPYLIVGENMVYEALYISIAVMVVALFVFGYVKKCCEEDAWGSKGVNKGCVAGLQMVVAGSTAAACAMGLVKAFSYGDGSL